ncbi:MAG: Hsp20/alpha crystallin family protein [Candidatus Lokiarchaeota archaeon]|nr:Hsp20/alpha crystallin family protein [Candidatus Lokiarchaeota archaeon]
MTSIILRRPNWYLEPFDLFEDFDTMIDKFWGDFSLDMSEFRMPRHEIKELDKEYLMELEMPGLSKEDIKFEIVNNTDIEIKGEKRTSETEVEEGNYEKKERHYNKFYHKLTLPKEVDVEKIEAKMENGILLVHLPKIEKLTEKTEIKVE